jgi:hypothetical protein
MPRYRLTTLIDITRADPNRLETDSFKISQQANFNSLIQAIGLRSNVQWAADPRKSSGILPMPFEGKAAHWTWDFECEREDVFLKAGNPVGLLIEDLHGVPIITNLDNSADLNPAAIQTLGDNINTLVIPLS